MTITEEQARKWFHDSENYTTNPVITIESFIRTGKEKGYIEMSHLEKARNLQNREVFSISSKHVFYEYEAHIKELERK